MRFALVLGGGGLRGLAHIGVIEALVERELDPVEIVGNSVGSLIAAAWCNGTHIGEIRSGAERLVRSDLFRIAHFNMAFRRMLSPAVYRREPLEALARRFLGSTTFDGLQRPLLVNTVDINAGTPVFWGLPGLRDVAVADAVYASCALPGIYPPGEIQGRYYVDGATISNLPVAIAARQPLDFVLAVDVGRTTATRERVEDRGFASIYSRAAELMMQRVLEGQLRRWQTPPLVLVRPRVGHLSLFSFAHRSELLAEGARAMAEVLDAPWFPPVGGEGVYPRRRVHVEVDRERCIGCEACLTHGPRTVFQLDEQGKAVCLQPKQDWSPLDGSYLRVCPTRAITARTVAAPS
jgi:NTE family protein